LIIAMLGEQIAELKGKIMVQRVLDAQGPTMEASISASGSVKGTQVNEMLTFMGKPKSSGVLHGVGLCVMEFTG
jgi:hypothetical protein